MHILCRMGLWLEGDPHGQQDQGGGMHVGDRYDTSKVWRKYDASTYMRRVCEMPPGIIGWQRVKV